MTEQDPRFGFGANWKNYIKLFTEARLIAAKESLTAMFELESLQGKTFLDIGSGSGLFSLAAQQLGASVTSFDFDKNSVDATQSLTILASKESDDQQVNWSVEQGSVLDDTYMQSLGVFDIVYSWGVLHHTGDQWKAIANAAERVRPHGLLYIALYNDQGFLSRCWTRVKKVYNSGTLGRSVVSCCFVPPIAIYQAGRSFAMTGNPLRHFQQHKERGMSPFHDVIDWIGGYPFEVSKPGEVVDFLRKCGFQLIKLRTTNGHGNNEFVFQRTC